MKNIFDDLFLRFNLAFSATTCYFLVSMEINKIKLIKTTVRNIMTDDRLSGLCLLAIECDIDVNFEQLIDEISDIYKNNRIMLK